LNTGAENLAAEVLEALRPLVEDTVKKLAAQKEKSKEAQEKANIAVPTNESTEKDKTADGKGTLAAAEVSNKVKFCILGLVRGYCIMLEASPNHLYDRLVAAKT